SCCGFSSPARQPPGGRWIARVRMRKSSGTSRRRRSHRGCCCRRNRMHARGGGRRAIPRNGVKSSAWASPPRWTRGWPDGVLRESSAEAMEFTRRAGDSGIGAGTLEHLEAVADHLSRAYVMRPAGEVFVVSRAYRRRVHELLHGPATLQERRQLYIRAAW